MRGHASRQTTSGGALLIITGERCRELHDTEVFCLAQGAPFDVMLQSDRRLALCILRSVPQATLSETARGKCSR